MNLNQKAIDSIIKLAPFDRYKYFIKKVADFEIMFTLIDVSGGPAVSEIDDHKVISLWSAPEFAVSFKTDLWKDYEVHQISLDSNLRGNELIKIAQENNFLLNVFPVNSKSGFIVTIDEFTRDIEEEYQKYF